ncbi:MAG: hypothetical protein A2Y84_01065 [Candidatus Colwellbacteria bacterium RBG_13_48_8]|uniref:AB hydrolase-1 domain-containing protein n=1 Tax=Candidatus Colwellbacteria bacterium RBG_13_48_8 TaxID=1797685 RepID=A0A1G1YV98_9BACT|nr:MAG: hypothetical protein A2Y84_01065 [Candidatus Colwellbacteria bacterium RBG_13_48_8]
MKENLKVKLKDGRWLSYAEYGDTEGQPVFFFHGSHGSRLLAGFMHSTAQKLNLRIIAPERPGFGLSDFQPKRTFLDWPADVVELADHLKIRRFGILGHSGGAIYAAACAYKIPSRLSKVVLVSGAVPYEMKSFYRRVAPHFRLLEFTAAYLPWLSWLFLHYSRFLTYRLPRLRLAILIFSLAESLGDQDLLWKNDVFGRRLLANLRESDRQGIKGIYWEWCLYARPWGFDLEKIKAPVSVFGGEDDVLTPPDMVERLAELIPQSRLHIIPDEGHYSLLYRHQREVLREFTIGGRK